MKYPTGEYRTLLCLYRQVQQPEPVVFSRTLREHHVLVLANTPKLTLYFSRQGKRYWLVNEKPCLGLPAFRYPAGQPGRFFTPSLKNHLCVKLHHILDNNAQAIAWFQCALLREARCLFDHLTEIYQRNNVPSFRFTHMACADSRVLQATTWRVLPPPGDQHHLVLTLRHNGLGLVILEATLHYYPLPFGRQQVTGQQYGQSDGVLSTPLLADMKAKLSQLIPDLVASLFNPT